MSSREAILARIRANLGKPDGLPSPQEKVPVHDYLKSHPCSLSPIIDWTDFPSRFKERAIALKSTVDEVSSLMDAPATIRRYLDANALPRRGVCWPELATLNWDEAGIELEARPAKDNDLLGITTAFCAIAETGTLMLLSSAETLAKTSLLPETHIAIIHAADILKMMEEAWDLLRSKHGKLPRSVNFISGPSRTADIEQTLVIGAHGPYRVHIIIVR